MSQTNLTMTDIYRELKHILERFETDKDMEIVIFRKGKPTAVMTAYKEPEPAVKPVKEKDWSVVGTWEDELAAIRKDIDRIITDIVVADGSARLQLQQQHRLLKSREKTVKMEILKRKVEK